MWLKKKKKNALNVNIQTMQCSMKISRRTFQTLKILLSMLSSKSMTAKLEQEVCFGCQEKVSSLQKQQKVFKTGSETMTLVQMTPKRGCLVFKFCGNQTFQQKHLILKLGQNWVMQQDSDPKHWQIYIRIVEKVNNQSFGMASSTFRP